MNNFTEQETRIVIIGAGPVGLALALVLARYHVPSLILETRAAPTPADESRAITWMPKGLEFLDWLGLLEPFAQQGVQRTTHEFWSTNERLLTLSFEKIASPYRYSLQLPQHMTESLLERAALATGLVELRRQHQVVDAGERAGQAWVKVMSPSALYQIETAWAVGCDGAKSQVRKALGIAQQWRDYGTDSAVADFEMTCDLPCESSRIILDPVRPYGFFYFAPDRWRFVYRLNKDEDRQQTITESAATALLIRKLPGVKIKRFLWASAFRLGQGQSKCYRQGAWLLAGDAAHAMGPSAGAGMMVGMLGAWRLGWRLAQVANGHSDPDHLLGRYEYEQRQASEAVQNANAQIFWNMAVTNALVASGRDMLLKLIGHIPSITRSMTAKETLVNQQIDLPQM